MHANLHCHTVYSDGANTPEEMIRQAIDQGMESLGISDHAYAPYDLDCCIPAEKMEAYRRELYTLKAAYADRLPVYVGLEVDAFHLHPKEDWDYVIGSVHYVRGRQGYHCIDDTVQRFTQAIEDLGSIRALAEAYGQSLMELASGYTPHILGHLDILTKLPRQGKAKLDPTAAWYREMWWEITDTIASSGCMVEVNTAGIYRRHCLDPYPSLEILRMLREKQVPVILASDAHQKENLTGGFRQGIELLQAAGYTRVKGLGPRGFKDMAL